MSPLELLYEALSEPLGILVRTDDTEGLRQKLYRAMRSDPEVDCFTIHLSRLKPTEELLIVKKVATDEP